MFGGHQYLTHAGGRKPGSHLLQTAAPDKRQLAGARGLLGCGQLATGTSRMCVCMLGQVAWCRGRRSQTDALCMLLHHSVILLMLRNIPLMPML